MRCEVFKEEVKMAEIALLGYGTVGSGVAEVLTSSRGSLEKRTGQRIILKKILDIRKFPGSPVEELLTDDINEILYDKDISVIAELMGGIEPAYSYVKKALELGKSVVTSNKELVAAHGAELLTLARERNINFLFEASVGGGIPIIRPLNQSLTADEIREIKGILNGTTNYILSELACGADFDAALDEARRLGYAERDCSNDLDGKDTCRKLAILLSLAIGRQVDFEDIHTEGIRNITSEDFVYARKLGCTIKLLAESRITQDAAYARVSPALVRENTPLSVVNGVFNAILIKGSHIDEVMFYGKGAGKFPTASAVAADIVEAVRHLNHNIMQIWSSEKHEVLTDETLSKLVRVAFNDKSAAMASVKSIFNVSDIIETETLPDEFGFIPHPESESELGRKTQRLSAATGVSGITNMSKVAGE
jgi:homoserine dehydrogenase